MIQLDKDKTVIISNGSKWHGQEPEPIEQLFVRLKEFTIEEDYFAKIQIRKDPITFEPVYGNINPISENNGTYRFFGNFEEVSAVFNIYTTDSELILKLSNAIKENRGWHLYYEKNLFKQISDDNQIDLFNY